MPTTVIGLFKTPDEARRAFDALSKKGIGKDELSLFDSAEKELADRFADFGIPEEDGAAFAAAVEKGAAVILADLDDDDEAGPVLELLQRNKAHAVDSYSDEEDEGEEDEGSERPVETETLAEAEETVNVGKRLVSRGGVRARTRVTERPVKKTVTLKRRQAPRRDPRAEPGGGRPRLQGEVD